MTVLVTGGAGYIGSHVVRLLRDRGDDVCVVDDFTTGRSERVPREVRVLDVDLSTDDALDQLTTTMRDERVDSIIHFAAKKRVDESVERPAWYYRQNLGGLANLLLAADSADVRKFVFSSSAAVYGSAQGAAIRESDPTRPVNPYGSTKLFGEQLIAEASAAGRVRGTSLRYFNVAGAGWDDLGDTAVLNLVPMVFERIDAGESPLVFGDDYDTPDGSCIRDYVHVLDLAEAHLAALDRLGQGSAGHRVYNVGTGRGTSVKEMVAAIARAAGRDIEPLVVERRAGDPAAVVADPVRIRDELGWAPRHDLDAIVASAWSAHLAHRE